MKQLDVCMVTGPGLTGSSHLVVVLQHHDFERLSGIVVAPMLPVGEIAEFDAVRLKATFKRRAYIIPVDRLGSVPKRQLGPALGNLDSLRFDLIRAVDLIFSGF